MWQLYIILFMPVGNASYGGPLIVEGFKTEAACIAHSRKIVAATPKSDNSFFNRTPEFIQNTCIQVEK